MEKEFKIGDEVVINKYKSRYTHPKCKSAFTELGFTNKEYNPSLKEGVSCTIFGVCERNLSKYQMEKSWTKMYAVRDVNGHECLMSAKGFENV